MLAIRLPADLEERLAALAEKTGRTKTFYARTAIEAYLDDLEDYYLAEDRMAGFDTARAIPLDDLLAKYDVAD